MFGALGISFQQVINFLGLCEFAGVAQFHFERGLSDAGQRYQQQVLEIVGTFINMMSM